MGSLKINSLITNTFIVLLSILISIWSFEIYLILKDPKPLEDWDSRTAVEVAEDISNLQEKIKFLIPPFYFIDSYKNSIKRDLDGIFPVGGMENFSTIMCNETGKFNKFFSDNYGLNNSNSAYSKNSKTILLGDSFAFGACVNENETLAYYLKDLNILNLSYSGNGPLLELKTLVDVQESISGSLDNFIYLYFEGNDFENLKDELKSKHLRSYLNCESVIDCRVSSKAIPNINYLKRSVYESIRNEFYVNEKSSILNNLSLQKIKSFLLARNLRERLNLRFNPHHLKSFEWNWAEYEIIISLLSNYADESEANKIFVYIPDKLRLSSKFNYHKQDVINLANNYDFKVVDLEPHIYKDKYIFNEFGFGHLSPEGYAFLSSLIKKEGF
tara:strand:+ start:693 stop:1850 length:1158 start_codon:yes stop_codon:yes gene_type:complete